MANIEKTVFISYRRKDAYAALAVYQYLTSQHYDVFLDYTSIPSGDFEQSIVSNIKARAHFILILTPTALERSSEPGDWLRREIETAIDEKRNIIPLFFEGFNFSAPGVAAKLTGKMGAIRRYNGLDIPTGYFEAAMERLCERYLNVPLDAVIHPVPSEVRKWVREERVAANLALQENKEDIDKLVKPAGQIAESVESPEQEGTDYQNEGVPMAVQVTPAQLSIAPGGSVSCTISLFNQSGYIDVFGLDITGIPGEWIGSVPSSVRLKSGERKQLEFTLNVPRTFQGRAGRRTLNLKVSSQNEPGKVVEVKLGLTLTPYTQFTAKLNPAHLRAGETLQVVLTNHGNVQETFTVIASDERKELSFQPTQQQVRVAEGQSAVLEVHARLRQPRWFGGEKSHSFQVHVSVPKAAPQTLQGSLLSRGPLPAWAPVTSIMFLCFAVGAIYFLKGIIQLQNPTATPNSPLTLQAQVTALAAETLTAEATRRAQAATETAIQAVQDDDLDGLSNQREVDLGLDPGNPDSDQDGLNDGMEVNQYTTDPKNVDSDQDTLTDGQEVNVTYTLPKNPDTDGDGVTDGQEVRNGTDPGLPPSQTPVPPTIMPTRTPIPTFTPTFTLTAFSGGPQDVSIIYVDTSYIGTEDGSQSRPYNTMNEGVSAARSRANGAYIYTKQSDGTWRYHSYVAPINPGASGGGP